MSIAYPLIDKIKLPNNTIYEIEDSDGRKAITGASSYTIPKVWTNGTAYTAKDLVWDEYWDLYRCVSSHTATTSNKPGASGQTVWVKTSIEAELKLRDADIASIISSGVNFRGITLTELTDGQSWPADAQISITKDGTTEDRKIIPTNGDIVIYRGRGKGEEFLYLDENHGATDTGIWYLIDAQGTLGAFAYAETAKVNFPGKKIALNTDTAIKPAKLSGSKSLGKADVGSAVSVVTGLGGTTSFNTNAIKSATLTSSTESGAGRISVVTGVGEFGFTPQTAAFNTNAIKSATLTSYNTAATGRIRVAADAIGSVTLSTATEGGVVAVTNAIKNATLGGTTSFNTNAIKNATLGGTTSFNTNAIKSATLSTTTVGSGVVNALPNTVTTIVTGATFSAWNFPTFVTGVTLTTASTSNASIKVKYLNGATPSTATAVTSASLTGTTTFVTGVSLTSTTTFVKSASLTGTQTFTTEGIVPSYNSDSTMLVFTAATTGTVGINAPTGSVGVSISTGAVGLSAPTSAFVTGYTFTSAYAGLTVSTGNVTEPVIEMQTTAAYGIKLSTTAADKSSVTLTTTAADKSSVTLSTTAADTTNLIVTTGAPTYTYLANVTAAAGTTNAITGITPIQPDVSTIYLYNNTAAADKSSVTKQTKDITPATAAADTVTNLLYDSSEKIQYVTAVGATDIWAYDSSAVTVIDVSIATSINSPSPGIDT